jgi:hypothetical protein
VTTRVPPPLVGFNNNFRYRGMSFHIQTEDSGLGRPHIITHLFADGGRVIKTRRIDYSEHVNGPDCRELVQRMMRDQHRAMAIDLRKGEVDAIIDELMPRQSASGTDEAARSSPGPADEAVGAERASPKPASRTRGVAGPTAARTTALSGVFAALPPDSLDDLIVRYIAGRR